MENSIPYCGDLHIDAGTKKLILNLLISIRSVVPAAGPPEPTNPEDAPEIRSLEYVRNVLVLARKHSRELEGFFNPDELFRYTRYVSDYQEIILQLEQVLEEMKANRNAALQFAGGLAEMVENHLGMTSSSAEEPSVNEYAGNTHVRWENVKLKIV